MAGFFKKLFGGRNDAADMLQEMMEQSEKWQIKGAEIAQDCYQNGLLQGKFVYLSVITDLIKKNHPHNGNIVESGFLNQMMSYNEQGVVVFMDIEGGDMAFIHKDHVSDVIESIKR